MNGLRLRYIFVNHRCKDGIEKWFLKLWGWIVDGETPERVGKKTNPQRRPRGREKIRRTRVAKAEEGNVVKGD